MSTIPCRAFPYALDWLQCNEVNLDIWVIGLPVRIEQLRNPEHCIDWGLYLELCARLPRIAGQASGQRETGREFGRWLFTAASRRAAVTGQSLEDIYRSLIPEIGLTLLPDLAFRATVPAPGMVDIHALIDVHESDCLPLLDLVQGILSQIPALLEMPPVRVARRQAAQHSIFRITLFEPEVDSGQERLAEPLTGSLEQDEHTASAVRQALLETTTVEEIAELVIEQLCSSCPSASLWLRKGLRPHLTSSSQPFDSEHAAFEVVTEEEASLDGQSRYELIRKRGDPIKPPSQSLRLALPDHIIGRLDLWAPPEPETQLALALDSLLPWLCLALESACLREKLQAYDAANSLQAQDSREVLSTGGRDDRPRSLLDSSPDVFCELGPDARLLFVGARVEEMLGHPREFYLGKSFLEFILPEEREALLQLFQELLLNGASQAIAFRSPHANGTIRVLEATTSCCRDEQGEIRVVAVVRDISERHRRDTELRQSEERYRSLLETGSMFFAIVDPLGRIVSSSPNLERDLGISRSGELGPDIMGRIHPDDRESARRAWHVSAANAESGSCDLRFIRDDGSVIWQAVTWRPTPSADGRTYFSVVSHDITTRKESERALRAISRGLGDTGEAFRQSLVEHLATALQVDAAAFGLVDADSPNHVQTLAIWRDGAPVENLRYCVEGTPCAKVLEGEACTHPVGLHQLFPVVARLFGDTYESYAGLPIRDAAGHAIGLLHVLHRRSLSDPDLARSMLEIFAQRAETELAREQAVGARVESEQRHRAISESSSDLLVEFSREAGIEYISPNVSEVLGYEPDAAATAELLEIVHPDDRATVSTAMESLWRDEELRPLQVRILHADGSWRWLEASFSVFQTQRSQRRAVALCRDVTRRMLAQQDREQLVSVIQNSSDIILLASVTGSTRFLNAAGRLVLGLEQEEGLSGRTIFDFLPGEEAELMRFQVMPTVLRNRRWCGEVRLCNPKSGVTTPTEATFFLVDDPSGDQTAHIAAICRDVSESRRAEQQLRESEERYRMLAENPYELISELDAEGRFVYVSPNFDTILGYSPEDLLGRDAFQLLPTDDRAEIEQLFRDVVRAESSFHAPFRIRHRDGSYRWLDSTARAYRTAQDQVMAVLISRDITERRRSADALRQSEDRLRQAQKMEAIGRLAGGVAHDFNNLLTAIIGYCDLLLEELGGEHPGREDAEEILKAADRAGGLTRQLLAFSRRQVLQPRVLDLNSLVADIDRMLRRLIGEDIELRTVLDGELEPVKADPGQLEQVILNLVVNARDAMPRGGRITLITANEEVPEADPTEENAVPPGAWVTLRVSDTGTGMDPATLSRIFDPFFTTKPTGEGTGLGLSTVIGIVSQSGGHMRVQSRIAEGTTFTIYLPCADEMASEFSGFAPPAELRGSETILLVEDAAPVRKLVERFLVRQGYTVLEANSGVAALRHCKRHPGPIQLLLTDVILPRMGGHDIAQRVQDLRPDIRVIYMSGFTDDSLSKHGVLAEDVVLLEKPFTPGALLSTVRSVMDATPES